MEKVDMRLVCWWNEASQVFTGLHGEITSVCKDDCALQRLVYECLVNGKVERVEIGSGTTHASDDGGNVRLLISQVDGDGFRGLREQYSFDFIKYVWRKCRRCDQEWRRRRHK